MGGVDGSSVTDCLRALPGLRSEETAAAAAQKTDMSKGRNATTNTGSAPSHPAAGATRSGRDHRRRGRKPVSPPTLQAPSSSRRAGARPVSGTPTCDYCVRPKLPHTTAEHTCGVCHKAGHSSLLHRSAETPPPPLPPYEHAETKTEVETEAKTEAKRMSPAAGVGSIASVAPPPPEARPAEEHGPANPPAADVGDEAAAAQADEALGMESADVADGVGPEDGEGADGYSSQGPAEWCMWCEYLGESPHDHTGVAHVCTQCRAVGHECVDTAALVLRVIDLERRAIVALQLSAQIGATLSLGEDLWDGGAMVKAARQRYRRLRQEPTS